MVSVIAFISDLMGKLIDFRKRTQGRAEAVSHKLSPSELQQEAKDTRALESSTQGQ